MPILIAVVTVLGVGFFVMSRSKKESGGNRIQFFSLGKEAGFTFKEIDMLRHIAAQCNIENPSLIFSVQSQLDICIRSLVRGIRMSGGADEQGFNDFLSKLYDFRKKIELEKPHEKHGISNSRQIAEGQMLRILVAGTGVFKSQVVKNISQYMTISRPVNNKNSSSKGWQGSTISVYFQREDDAGYVFDTQVLDEVFSLGISSLKIGHSDSLFRTQKRKSIRIKLNKAAFLYLVPAGEAPHKLEMDPGLKCFLEDLSDTGCAVTVGGKADAGLRVKVQFALDNAAICMTGTVRSTTFKEDINRSVLRIESEPLPMEIRNHILGEVFGMAQDDNEDELPFRVLDEEAANDRAGGVPADTGIPAGGGNSGEEAFDEEIAGGAERESGGL